MSESLKIHKPKILKKNSKLISVCANYTHQINVSKVRSDIMYSEVMGIMLENLSSLSSPAPC